MKIRQIVKDAFKIEGFVNQFEDVDVADGYLKSGSISEVNETYGNAYLVGEALHLYDIAMDFYNQDEPEWRLEANQLRRFIKKYEPQV
tara:strand:+ start:275 stop:538 length:264 start_codon:yes stop_codon:yes gene_type:complete